MREGHPVDELFRFGLERAELAPPARIWTGVVQARRQRRRRWLLALPLAVLMGVGAGVLLYQAGAPDPTGSLNAPETQTPRASDHDAVSPLTANSSSTSAHLGASAGKMDQTAHLSQGQPGGGVRIEAGQQRGLWAGHILDQPTTAPEPTPPSPGDVNPGPLALRHTFNIDTPDPVVHATSWTIGPARPSTRQWIGLETGLFRTTLRPDRKDEVLAAANERALGPGNAWSLGVRVGNAWAGGVSISTGLTYVQRSVPLFYEDLRDSISTEVSAWVTVFNNAVVDLVVDTQITVVDQSIRGSGVQRYRAFQVPVEVAWHGRLRRWLFGGHAGVLWEHVRWTAGPGLVRSAQDTHIALTTAPGSRSDQRGADMVGITFGLDAGFRLDGRHSIWAGPVLQRALVIAGGDGSQNGLPSSYGLRFRITRTLP